MTTQEMTAAEAITPPKREPFADNDEANAAMTRFLELVSEARIECRMSAVTLVVATEVYEVHDPHDTGTLERTGDALAVIRAAHVGENPDGAAELAAFAYQNFGLPVVGRARRLAGAVAGECTPFVSGTSGVPATKISAKKREAMI